MDPRPCHSLYIEGRCDGKGCKFGHGYEVGNPEVRMLVLLAKEMVCTQLTRDEVE